PGPGPEEAQRVTRSLSSAPTPQYGAPALPITTTRRSPVDITRDEVGVSPENTMAPEEAEQEIRRITASDLLFGLLGGHGVLRADADFVAGDVHGAPPGGCDRQGRGPVLRGRCAGQRAGHPLGFFRAGAR